MAWTNWGFDGTINEAQWSQMAGLLGNGYVAAGNGDCLVTAVGGARSVSVAAGTLYGDGVVSVNSGAETVAMTTPVNGQWYVIVLTRTWATNSVALRAVAGATTSTTTPTAPPTSFPTLNTNVGVLTDQPIAWAWCNSANTTVVVYDLRMNPYKQTNPLSVASVNDRDAKFPAPVQGTTVWRNDLGALETYFGLYNVSTNPGGRSAAGWYQETKGRTLQTIIANSTNRVTVTSSSLTDLSFTATITPIQPNSKILITVNTSVSPYAASGNLSARLALYRNAGAVSLWDNQGYIPYTTPTGSLSVPYTFSFTETVSDTSARTYQVFGANMAGGGTYFNGNANAVHVVGTITITEISA